MAAEYAMHAQFGTGHRYRFESAGIEAKPQTIHPMIRARLVQHGIDPAKHIQRRLTQELIDRVDLIIAMGQDHRDWIHRRFDRNVPLFNQVSFGMDAPILDLHEALPNWECDLEAARVYVESVIDHIWSAAPMLVARLPQFL